MFNTRDSDRSPAHEPRLSRWHLAAHENHLLAALLMIAGFSLARALSAVSFTGFGLDEAYTVAMSRRLALSYFDHPPLHQWITHVSLLIFGATPWIRLPFVLISAVTGWLLYDMTRRVFGGPAGLWALLAFGLSPYFYAVAGSWVSPDGVLILCLAGAARAALTLLSVDRTAPHLPWRHWIVFGVWAGFAGLSKYTAVFLPAGLLMFLAFAPQHRHWFGHPAPYCAAIIAALIVAPVLIWNGQNDWVSFAFQAGRAVPVTGGDLERLLMLLAGQMGYLSPMIFPCLVIAALWTIVRSSANGPERLLLWFALPSILILTCTPIWGNSGFPHWTMPGWFLLFPLFGGWMTRWRPFAYWKRVWAGATAGLTLALAVLFASIQSSDWLERAFPALLKADPVSETLSWRPLRAADAFRPAPGWAPAFVVAQNWIEGGKVDLAVGEDLPVFVFSADPRGFAFRSDPSLFVGADAVIVAQASATEDLAKNLRPYFAVLDVPEPLTLGRAGRAEVHLRVMRGHGLIRPFPQPYGPWRTRSPS